VFGVISNCRVADSGGGAAGPDGEAGQGTSGPCRAAVCGGREAVIA
jgi:hypothetical protein